MCRDFDGPSHEHGKSNASGPAALKQASNCLTIDRWCSPLEPIECGKPVVVSGCGIAPVIEKNAFRCGSKAAVPVTWPARQDFLR